MELHGRAVVLRPARADDVERLTAILAEPSVAAWWPAFDVERVRTELVAERADEEGFVIENDGAVIGYLQIAEETDAEFRHASIDLFLATDAQGRGLGPDAIRAAAIHLIEDRGHHRLTIDPAADNARAIVAYAKLGFRPVGILRSYQLMADGHWADALLMDLLAPELVR